MDLKLWDGAAAAGWRVLPKYRGSSATNNWLYLAPKLVRLRVRVRVGLRVRVRLRIRLRVRVRVRVRVRIGVRVRGR